MGARPRLSRGGPARPVCAPLLAAAALLALGCEGWVRAPAANLTLATTTSVEDSGLLSVLAPAFEAATSLRLRTIAVGTGEALELGRRGDADVVLVHAPAAESAFVAAGHGTERRPVMYNDFVILGPASDPAGVRGAADAAAALGRIAAAQATFVSRGDDSGTHMRELELWSLLAAERPDAGEVPPARRRIGTAGAWYQEAGQGMANVLVMANERLGYTLSDRSTYLYLRPRLELEILLDGDPRLVNPYGVVPVTRAKDPERARMFVEWVTGPEARAIIAEYGRDRVGEPLFTPGAPPSPDPGPSGG